MTEKKIKQITTTIVERSKSKARKCLVTGCESIAINSHALQKNGILNRLSKNEHLYEVKRLNFPEEHFSIVREGINRAMTFRGLCQKHDDEIFKEIESSQNLDLGIYRTLTLLSYRSILKEYREKEILLDIYTRIQGSATIKDYYDQERLKGFVQANTFLFWDLEFLSLAMANDISSGSQSFEFVVVEMPLYEICASATYSTESIAGSFLSDDMAIQNKRLINAIVINAFPHDGMLKAIFGVHKESTPFCKETLKAWTTEEQSTRTKLLNDLLIKNVTSWVCSEAFFESYIKPRKVEFTKSINYFTRQMQFSSTPVKFDIFGVSI